MQSDIYILLQFTNNNVPKKKCNIAFILACINVYFDHHESKSKTQNKTEYHP